MRTAKTLIRLDGCPGWSESSLGAHSFCWFCHEAAHMLGTRAICRHSYVPAHMVYCTEQYVCLKLASSSRSSFPLLFLGKNWSQNNIQLYDRKNRVLLDQLCAHLRSFLTKYSWLFNSTVLHIPRGIYIFVLLLTHHYVTFTISLEFMFWNLRSFKTYLSQFLRVYTIISTIWLGSLFLCIISLNRVY